MKKLIRWLSDITGVSDIIRDENTKYIGHQMYNYSYWFTGGLVYGNITKYDIANAYAVYAEILIKGETHLFSEKSAKLRDKLYQLSEKNESVHKN